MLLILSGVLLVTAALIVITMGRPVFFVHTRSGKHREPFEVIKFRTMITAPDLTDEQRITRFGLWLRKTSIDELPQLLNVIRGDMSLVGPRPLLPEYDEHYTPVQLSRFLVRPGITGLAQVKGRNSLSWSAKFEYDTFYVDRLSFYLDLKILLETVVVVFRGAGFNPAGEEKKFSEN